MLLSLTLILYKCSDLDHDAYVNRDFIGKSINLKGTQILDSVYGAIELNVFDTILLVRLKSNNTLFKLFSINNLSFISDLGVYGDGPDEWRAPRYCGQYCKTSTSYLIWINDIFKNRFILVELEGLNVKIIKEHQINPVLNMDRDLFYQDSNCLIGNQGMDAIQKARLCFYNPISDSIKYSWDLPEIEDVYKLTRNEVFDIFFDHLRMKSDGSLFVSAFERFDRIDKMDRDGQVIKSMLGNERNGYSKSYISDFKTNDGMKNLKYYYTWLQATDKYIYALYLDQTDEYYNVAPKPVEIHVFDWELNSIYNLKINDYLICFAVDKNNSCVYGLDYYNEKILQYDISFMDTEYIIPNYDSIE